MAISLTGLSGLINRPLRVVKKLLSFVGGVGVYPNTIWTPSTEGYTNTAYSAGTPLYGNVDWASGTRVLTWMGLSGRYFGTLTKGMQIYHKGKVLAQGPVDFAYSTGVPMVGGAAIQKIGGVEYLVCVITTSIYSYFFRRPWKTTYINDEMFREGDVSEGGNPDGWKLLGTHVNTAIVPQENSARVWFFNQLGTEAQWACRKGVVVGGTFVYVSARVKADVMGETATFTEIEHDNLRRVSTETNTTSTSTGNPYRGTPSTFSRVKRYPSGWNVNTGMMVYTTSNDTPTGKTLEQLITETVADLTNRENTAIASVPVWAGSFSNVATVSQGTVVLTHSSGGAKDAEYADQATYVRSADRYDSENNFIGTVNPFSSYTITQLDTVYKESIQTTNATVQANYQGEWLSAVDYKNNQEVLFITKVKAGEPQPAEDYLYNHVSKTTYRTEPPGHNNYNKSTTVNLSGPSETRSAQVTLVFDIGFGEVVVYSASSMQSNLSLLDHLFVFADLRYDLILFHEYSISGVNQGAGTVAPPWNGRKVLMTGNTERELDTSLVFKQGTIYRPGGSILDFSSGGLITFSPQNGTFTTYFDMPSVMAEPEGNAIAIGSTKVFVSYKHLSPDFVESYYTYLINGDTTTILQIASENPGYYPLGII